MFDQTKMDAMKKPDGAKGKPIDHIRAGNVSASIWENKAKVDGADRTFHNVTFQRSYRDEKEKDDQGNPVWKNTDSYGIGDLIKLSTVAQAVYLKYGITSDDDRK